MERVAFNTWYKASDNDWQSCFYNYFISLDDDKIGYYSVGFGIRGFGYFMDYMEDFREVVMEEIFDNFVFKKVALHDIIKDCFS